MRERVRLFVFGVAIGVLTALFVEMAWCVAYTADTVDRRLPAGDRE